MSRVFYRDELIGAEVLWLVVLDYAGREWFLSSRPCEITDADGRVRVFTGGLSSVGLEEGAEFLSTTPTEVAVSVSIDLGVDVAELVELGHRLDAARAEVARWIVGTSWEDREVKVRDATLLAPSIPRDGEPIDCTIQQRPYDDKGLYPPADHVVSVDAWPTLENDDAINVAGNLGKVYPTIIGAPGVYSVPVSGEYIGCGWVAPVVAREAATVPLVTMSDVILLAGHWLSATEIGIQGDGTYTKTFTIVPGLYDTVTELPIGTQTGLTVVNGYDSLGRRVAYIETIGQEEVTEYNVLCGGSTYYGLPNPYGTGHLEGAGDVIRWMLSKSTLAVDYGRMAAAMPILNRYRLAGYIDEHVTPWQWLTDHVLAFLPVSVVTGPDGLYPVVWDPDARAVDAVDLDAAPGLLTVESVEVDDVEIVNALTVRFAPLTSDDFQVEITVNGEPYSGAAGVCPDVYARLSSARYGDLAKTIDLSYVCDAATAWAIAHNYIRARSLPHTLVTVLASVELDWWRPGHTVKITDSARHWTDKRFVVETKIYDGDDLRFRLRHVDDPPRDEITT